MLRRRHGKDDANSSPDDPASPTTTTTTTTVDKDTIHPTTNEATQTPELVHKRSHERRNKRRNGFIFLLGGLFGIIVALFFANQQEVISLDSLTELNLDSLVDVLPQGVMKDVKEFSVTISLTTFWVLPVALPLVQPIGTNLRPTSSSTNVKPSATMPSPSA